MVLTLEVRKPGEKTGAAIARRQAGRAPAPYWTGLSRDEYAQQPGALREWAGQVARVQFPAYMA